MKKQTVRITLHNRDWKFKGYLDVQGFVYPDVGLAVTQDVEHLAFNVTHLATGNTVNTIPQTEARCKGFVRKCRENGWNWQELDRKNPHKFLANHAGLYDEVLGICRRNSQVRKRQRPLNK